MKNKNLLIGIAIVLIVAAAGFGTWKLFFSGNEETVIEEDVAKLPRVDDSVKVSVKGIENNTKVVISVDNIPDKTTSIDVELTYNTAQGLPKGAIGKIRLSGESSATKEILLGTCSRGVCRYDEGVEKVSVILRFNSSDGASIFEDEFTL